MKPVPLQPVHTALSSVSSSAPVFYVRYRPEGHRLRESGKKAAGQCPRDAPSASRSQTKKGIAAHLTQAQYWKILILPQNRRFSEFAGTMQKPG